MAEDPSLSLNAAVQRIGIRVGVVPDTLRGWAKQHRIDTGQSPGTTSDARRIKDLGSTECSGLPVARYDPEALVSALGGAFDVLDTRRQRHVTPQGKAQSITWVSLRRH